MKKYSYYIIPHAREEFRVARIYYRQLGVKGLSQRFSRSIKDAISRIQANPFAFTIRYKNMRVVDGNLRRLVPFKGVF